MNLAREAKLKLAEERKRLVEQASAQSKVGNMMTTDSVIFEIMITVFCHINGVNVQRIIN